MANPLHTDPKKPRGHSFLERFPYALPNIVAACIFFIGITTGFLFLRVSLSVLWNPISCVSHKWVHVGKYIELRNVTFEVLRMLVPNDIYRGPL